MDQGADGVGGVARGVNRAIVALRHVMVLAWIAAAVAAVAFLPGMGDGSDLGLPLPEDAAPLQAERRAVDAFGFPLLARTQVVVRDPEGLSATDQAALGEFALSVSRGEVEGLEDVVAIPLTNAAGVAPGARESGTAVLTYLLIAGEPSIPRQVTIAEVYAAAAPVPEGATVGVTGSSPSRDQQLATIQERMPYVVGLTLALIVLAVGLVFRSLIAPLVVLGVVAVAWLVTMRLIGWSGEVTGMSAGKDIEPIVSALLIGVVTDYAIFHLFGMRDRLRETGTDGPGRRTAAIGTGAHYIAIIVTAGITTALGTAALLAGRLDFFRAFAPALALSALVAVLVSVTLLPALLALLGPAAYWPRGLTGDEGTASRARRAVRARAKAPLGARLLATRGVAAATALVVLVGLLGAAWQVRDLQLGLGLDSGVSAGAAQVDAGFGPGYRAPTEVLIEGEGVADPAALARVGDALRSRPEQVGVIGPGDVASRVLEAAFVAPDAGTARLLVVLAAEPTESAGIDLLDSLQAAMPQLLAEAGLPGARAAWVGDTAIAQAAIDAIGDELLRVGLVALAVNLLLMMLFLRAAGAPLYLLLANVLSVAATLGLATWMFQEVLDHGQLVYYVPFAAAVLLLALGSDYNIYLMGQIWRQARDHGLQEAVRRAVPLGSRPIAVAGLVLAGSFALLALVPVDAMRQFAFVMGVGVLLDAFIVRTLLVPSLVTLFGRAGYWPGRPPVTADAPPPPPEPPSSDAPPPPAPAGA